LEKPIIQQFKLLGLSYLLAHLFTRESLEKRLLKVLILVF